MVWYCTTDNTTEYLLGFWSLHGDVGDYGMIQGLWKTEVYDMSEWLVNNELIGNDAVALSSCINCQATDGLGISNTDLDQIMPGWKGSSRDGYKKVDEIFDPIAEDKNAVLEKGIHFCVNQCQDLINQGAPGIHFYTLNKFHPIDEIFNKIKPLL